MKENRDNSLDALSPRTRGLLADLMQPMATHSRPIYDLPNCTRYWHLAHQAFPGLRGPCELTVDQMIVLNRDIREMLEFLGITQEWIGQQLEGRSPSDVANPRSDQE